MADEVSTIYSDISDSLGVSKDDPSFQTELLIDIGSALATLVQLNITKPVNVTTTTSWDDIKDSTKDYSELFPLVHQYILISVKLVFDPPAGSTLSALLDLKKELEWRLKTDFDVGGDILWAPATPKS